MNQNHAQIARLLSQAWAARRNHDADKALALASRAVSLARAENHHIGLIQALTKLGQLKRDAGDIAGALLLYREAEAVCRHTGQKRLLAGTVRHLGDIFRKNRQLMRSRTAYEEAVSLYGQDPETSELELANAYRPMALLYDELKEPDIARSYWQKAYDLYRKLGVEAGVQECTNHLARTSR